MKMMPLNNDWFYKPEFQMDDTKTSDNLTGFQSVRLPHTSIELPYHYFDPTLYQFESCYKRKLPQVTLTHDEEAVLHFEGVMLAARVYIDEHFVYEHRGGYTPFTVNITPYLHSDGREKWVTVQVDASERADIPPYGGVVDFLTYGGIYREVQLQIRNKQHFKAVRVQTNSKDFVDFEALLSLEFSEPLIHGQQVVAQIVDGNHLIAQQVFTIESDNIESVSKFIDEITMTIDAFHAEIIPWKLDHPHLYTLKLELLGSDDNTFIDSYETQFGFRTAEFKGDGFYLNGEKIKLRGLNRHQSYPYVGYAMPKSAQVLDADILKFELGVNIVRSSHYPPSRHFLDRCDAIGLLVFDEIPGWQHIGDINWQALALESVEAMIRRDINHPCVIIWGVRINESSDSDALYEATNALAHRLDPSRNTGGVRNFAGSHLFEDVYTYNDFAHRGTNQALEAPLKIAKKNVPYLVTEHNGHMYPAKSFDSEARRIEQALRHARVLNHAYGASDISGAIGWCMADYNTHKDFGSGDSICYHGVLDMFRLPKYAAALYASQTDDKPVMTVASNLFGGDYDAFKLGKITVFTNCDQVKIFKNDTLIKTYDQVLSMTHAASSATSPRASTATAPRSSAAPRLLSGITQRVAHDDFKNLPHPPVVIDDLIGDLIKDNERFTPKDAEAIKKILLKYTEVGNDLPLLYKVRMGLLFLKYKMNMEDAAQLYGKYIATWGEASTTFRFEGYQKDERVCVVEKSDLKGFKINLKADSHVLIEGDTYDVVRIIIQLTDDKGQHLQYSNAIVDVTLEGPIEVIGPNAFSLIAGGRAFWIKSTGIVGSAKVYVKIDGHLSETIALEVISLNKSL